MSSSVINAINRARSWVPDKYRKKSVVFGIISVALCLDNLSLAGAMTTSFSISEKFNAPESTVSWVISAYALTLGSFIILFGKFGDIIGPHIVFVIGTTIMFIFSLLCALPLPNIIVLIVFRALQGIGGAALIPSGFAIAANYYQGPQLESAIRVLSVVLTASFGIGTLLGGAFSLTSIGYQAFFYFCAGVAFACSVLLFFLIIPIEKTAGHLSMHVRDLDFPGCFCLVAGLLLVIFGLTESAEGWNSPKVYVPIPVGALLLIGMIMFEMLYLTPYQKKHSQTATSSSEALDVEKGSTKSSSSESDPQETEVRIPEKQDWRLRVQLFFPSEVLKITNFIQYAFGAFLQFFAYVALTSIFIQYHEYVENNSSILTSVKIQPLAAGVIVGSAIYRDRLVVGKFGTRNVVLFGGIVAVAMSVWISRLDYRKPNSYWRYEFVPMYLIAQLGINLYFMVYFNAVMTVTPLHLQGVVAGILMTFGQIGVAFSGSLLATVVGKTVYSTDSAIRLAMHEKYHNAFYMPMAAYVVFLLLMFTLREPKKA